MVAQNNPSAPQGGNSSHLQHGGGSLKFNNLMVGQTISLSMCV